MKVLVEGIGSMVFGTQLKYYKEMNWDLVGIDITNKSFGMYKNIKSYIVPKYSEDNCFNILEHVIEKEKIDLVIPSVDEGLIGWSKRKRFFRDKYMTEILISNEDVIDICVDKWKTYQFFKENSIPTPYTSLNMDYDLLKPRWGRGSEGIYLRKNIDKEFSFDGYISQQLLDGTEYTIDVLCDLTGKPIYIVPRIRIEIESGVSIKGKTVFDKKIIDYAEKIVNLLKPIGIINIQCIKDKDGINFIEINPRIGGGSSLSFASSDNWFRAINCFLHNEKYIPQRIIYNNYMFRYYCDVIVHDSKLINN